MLINEVEHLVGLSKKSIRYYEELGLLKTKRSEDNNYRLYTPENIQELRLIKFLRELDVPINDIKRLQNNSLTLNDCLKERIEKITKEQANYQKIKNMCQDIISKNYTYDNINIATYLEKMTVLNKEGFTMRSIKSIKKKKLIEATLSATIFCSLLIFLMAIITYFQITEQEQMPLILFIFILIILFLPVLGTIYNLIVRIKEIMKGEEDEASKY